MYAYIYKLFFESFRAKVAHVKITDQACLKEVILARDTLARSHSEMKHSEIELLGSEVSVCYFPVDFLTTRSGSITICASFT